MRFMYVDESGDPGPINPADNPANQPSRHFILSGVVVSSKEWRSTLVALIDIRRTLKNNYGFPIRHELHAAELFRPATPAFQTIRGHRRGRMAMYRDYCYFVAQRLNHVKLFHVHVQKDQPKFHAGRVTSRDILENAWLRLFQRFNTYLQRSCANDDGIVFVDQGNEATIRSLLRARRLHNIAPTLAGNSYPVPLTNIVEDPVMRDSKMSYLVQLADMSAHALYRKLYPKPAWKRFSADRFFDLLQPLVFLPASAKDPHKMGIVHV